ncbi:hypothetical protein NT6N_08110 [Oceaniferula spumae]|uniref:Nicotinic acid mononucleotide adenyltransferase n=1 Tax=Oceaniferula spumae TaxID=2979115 RepID=A0AAT9FIK1_9BACT
MKKHLTILAALFLCLSCSSISASVSNYIGKVGKSELRASLTYYRNGTVKGSYTSMRTGKRYLLQGNNFQEGRLSLKEYTYNPRKDGWYPTAQVYLYKQRNKGRIVWSGTMKNYDGRNVHMYLVKR